MGGRFCNSGGHNYNQRQDPFNLGVWHGDELGGIEFHPTMDYSLTSNPLDSMLYGNSSSGFGPNIGNGCGNTSFDLPNCDFDTSIEQAEVWAKRARIVYKEKEKACEASFVNQNLILQQLKERDGIIQRLQRDMAHDQLSNSQKVYRLKCELHMMGKLIMEYRERLKDVNWNFAEYRARHHLLSIETHSDNAAENCGGPILSTKGHDDTPCLNQQVIRAKSISSIEENVKKFEAEWGDRFEEHMNGLNLLTNRLLVVEEDLRLLKKLVREKQAL